MILLSHHHLLLYNVIKLKFFMQHCVLKQTIQFRICTVLCLHIYINITDPQKWITSVGSVPIVSGLGYTLRPMHISTKLPTKRLTTNRPSVKRVIGLITRQRQPAKTLMKAGVVSSSPSITVNIVFCANLISI